MVEPGVDHPVRRSGPTSQAVEVRQVAAMRLGPQRGQAIRARVRSGEADHPVAGLEEVRDDGGADEAGRAGQEYAHVVISLS